jgi:hypothetical protein
MSRFAKSIIFLSALWLVSCIDSHEEVWIDGNGAGRAEITYMLPRSALITQGGRDGLHSTVEKLIGESKDLRDTKVEITEENDRIRVFVSLAFDSVLKVSELVTVEALAGLPPAARHFVGETDIKMEGRDVRVTRTISPGKALPGSGFMPASEWKGHQLRYTIHLPQAVVDSNATRTENKGRTLIWEVPLADAISKPVVTRFEARIPIPLWVIAILTFLVVLAGSLLHRRIKRRRADRA